MLNNIQIGFIGHGRMGGCIARRLMHVGYQVTVYDVNKTALQSFEDGFTIAESVEQMLDSCDILMMSLPGSLQVEEIVGRMIAYGVNDKTIIDLSTSFPTSTVKLHKEVTEAGGYYIDAPLAGGPKNASEGTLTIMAGGDKNVFDRLEPLFNNIAKKVFYIGGPGSGNITKLSGNSISILYSAIYAEILLFAEKLGVDPQALFEVVSASGANSPIFQLVAPKIIKGEYDISFMLGLALKDLNYTKALFEENGISSVMLDAGLSLFEMADAKGIANHDISEIAEIVRERNGMSK